MPPADGGATTPSVRITPRLALARGVLAGALIGGVVLAAQGSGLLSGTAALAVTVVLALATPLATGLSHRALLAGSIVFGWIAVTWWLPLPFDSLGHASWLLALLTGGLAGWIAGGADPRCRLRQLLPRVGAVDLVPAGATIAAAYLLLPWLRVREGAAALSMLIPGWDNSAQVDMVAMVRRYGVTIDSLGAAPGGETWQFADYPQGFHAAVATVMELLGSPTPQSVGAEMATTVNAIGWVAVLAVGMLAAGLCALPGLGRRPVAAVLATTVVTAGFLLGPGAMALPGGFANFFFACALAASVPLVAVHVDRLSSPIPLLAIGGLLVGVAHSWLLLISLALPAAALVLLPIAHCRWPTSRRGWIGLTAILAMTGLGGLQAARVLSGLDATAVLTTQGGIATPDLGTLAMTLTASLALLAFALVRSADGTDVAETDGAGASARAAAAGYVVVVGLIVAAAIGSMQIRAWSSVTYYFWKYAIGLELVALVLAAVAGSVILATITVRAPTRGRAPRVLTVAGTVLLAGAALQLFGFTGVPGGPVPIAPTADGVVQRNLLTARAAAPSATATELLLAVTVPVPEGSHGVYLSPSSDVGVHPVSAQQWYLALTAGWTHEANLRAEGLMPTETGTEAGTETGTETGTESEAVRAVRVLADDPQAVVIVGPDHLPEVREALGRQADRALSW